MTTDWHAMTANSYSSGNRPRTGRIFTISTLAFASALVTGDAVRIGPSPTLSLWGLMVGVACAATLVRYLIVNDSHSAMLLILATSFHYQEVRVAGGTVQLVDIVSIMALSAGLIRVFFSPSSVRVQPTIVALVALAAWGGTVGALMGVGHETVSTAGKWLLLAGASWSIAGWQRSRTGAEGRPFADVLVGIVAVASMGLLGTFIGGWLAGLMTLNAGARPSLKGAAFLAPFAFGLAVGRRGLRDNLLASSALVLVLVAVVWSASRQLAAILIGSSVIWTYYATRQKGLPRTLGALLVVLSLATVLLLTLPPSQVARFTARVVPGTTAEITAASDSARLEIASVAVSAFRSSPIVGKGAGAFEGIAERNDFYDPNGALLAGPHSFWLLIAAETGIVGLGLVLIAISGVITSYKRRIASSKSSRWRVVGLGLSLYWGVSLTFGDFGGDELALMIVTLVVASRGFASESGTTGKTSQHV